MSYVKTTWVTGDIVTAPKLNNLESGVEANDLNKLNKPSGNGTAGQLLISNGDGSTSWTDTDTTLEESGKAADAKATGDALGEINEALETKAEIDGYYEEMTVGDAGQLVSTVYVEESNPYLYRTTGGSADVGNREYLDKLVGVSVAWNQLFEPNVRTFTVYGVSITIGADGKYSMSGTANGSGGRGYPWNVANINIVAGHVYYPVPGVALLASNVSDGSYYGGFEANKLTKKSTSAQVYFGINVVNGTEYNESGTLGLIDITQTFGTAIAEYAYSLETATAGSGIAWLKQYINLDTYHAYDAGTMKHVEDLQSHDTVGFNQWDEEWEVGGFSYTTGEPSSATDRIRGKNFCECLPSTEYFWLIPNQNLRILFYDAQQNYIGFDGWYDASRTITTPSNAAYFKLAGSAAYGTTYKNDICINLSWSGYRNGEYEPYEKHSYALDSSVVLRGVPTLVDGKLVYDGDEYLYDGTIKRRYAYVDLGTWTWSVSAPEKGIFWVLADRYNFRKNYGASNLSNIRMVGYTTVTETYYNTYMRNKTAEETLAAGDKTIWVSGSQNFFGICDSAFANKTVAEVKTLLSGKYLLYEEATPTTETADPYTQVQICDDFGTEQFVTTSIIPVGTETRYPANLRDKLQHLPSLAETDGTYLIQQTDKEMSLIPFSGYVTEESLEETLEDYAVVDGYYEGMTVGNAEELVTGLTEEENVPFIFRTSGGSLEIGAREELTVTGGSLAWNQLLKDISNVGGTGWRPYNASNGTITYENGELIYTISTVGNDPWPNTIRSSQFEKILNHKYLVSYDIYTPHEGSATAAYFNGYVSARVQVGWNTIQTVQNATATSTTAENYFGIAYAGNANYEAGETYKIKNPMFIDLTQMFGTTIADYIYSIEQTTAGAGVNWFKKLLPKDYYPFANPDLVHVNASEFKTIGFNQWDEEWEPGGISSGVPVSSSNQIRSKNFCPILFGTTYYGTCGKTDGGNQNKYYLMIAYYDYNKTWIKNEAINNLTFTTPTNAAYFKLYTNSSTVVYGNTYNHDICISIHWDNTRDGEYEPYTEHSYPLDSSLVLRGIPKIDADGNLYYDGDTYEADGTVTRRYGIVDLGTLSWAYATTAGTQIFYANLAGGRQVENFNGIISGGGYTRVESGSYFPTDKCYRFYGTTSYGGFSRIGIRNDSLTGDDIPAFKASMSGIYCVYELAESTTETADTYQTPQIVDNWGTEEFVVTAQNGVEVPVGHSTIYPISLRDKLEAAPDLPDDEGDFVLRMSSSGASYARLASEFPAPPTTDGSYFLKATVTNGTATLTWEAQS